MRTALLLTAAAAMALGGCATMQTARARLVKATPRCEDQTVQIYFAPDQAELTPEGRMVIAQAASNTRACKILGVDVLGLADGAGQAGANLELSRRRAQSVTAALAANGLPSAEFKMTAAGQAGAVTSGGQAAPLRRRADVTLHLAPR
ncbi:OmpA family protein [Phenylobacterium sp.]|uniref:OmpA family protein n=1 Tax=Phenylobacterium sp. TaxID=1871053 RepID=UPI002DE9A223|nr:OmpA family protein [Phenylobacterium sp.]